MTRDEAITSIVSGLGGKLTDVDVQALFTLSPEELFLVVDAYRIAQVMPTPNAWDVVLAILKECAELASLVIPLEGAIQGAFNIANAAQGKS